MVKRLMKILIVIMINAIKMTFFKMFKMFTSGNEQIKNIFFY